MQIESESGPVVFPGLMSVRFVVKACGGYDLQSAKSPALVDGLFLLPVLSGHFDGFLLAGEFPPLLFLWRFTIEFPFCWIRFYVASNLRNFTDQLKSTLSGRGQRQ